MNPGKFRRSAGRRDARRDPPGPRRSYCGFSGGGVAVSCGEELLDPVLGLVEELVEPPDSLVDAAELLAPALADPSLVELQAASDRMATDATAPMENTFMDYLSLAECEPHPGTARRAHMFRARAIRPGVRRRAAAAGDPRGLP